MRSNNPTGHCTHAKREGASHAAYTGKRCTHGRCELEVLLPHLWTTGRLFSLSHESLRDTASTPKTPNGSPSNGHTMPRRHSRQRSYISPTGPTAEQPRHCLSRPMRKFAFWGNCQSLAHSSGSSNGSRPRLRWPSSAPPSRGPEDRGRNAWRHLALRASRCSCADGSIAAALPSIQPPRPHDTAVPQLFVQDRSSRPW